MHTTTLQALIRTNARAIANAHMTIEMHVEDAKFYVTAGEKAFSVEAYKLADKVRPKLAKLVAVQRELKTELASAHRETRINKKIALLEDEAFIHFIRPSFLTSVEVEQELDMLVAKMIQPAVLTLEVETVYE